MFFTATRNPLFHMELKNLSVIWRRLKQKPFVRGSLEILGCLFGAQESGLSRLFKYTRSDSSDSLISIFLRSLWNL